MQGPGLNIEAHKPGTERPEDERPAIKQPPGTPAQHPNAPVEEPGDAPSTGPRSPVKEPEPPGPERL